MSKSPRRPPTNRFDRAPQANIPRSRFDLSHPVKTTFDSGYLIPLPPYEVLPGDSFRLRMFSFTRLATPLHPTLDNLYLESFFFFVPNRLVWDNWQKFMGEQDNPGDSTDFTIPTLGNSIAEGDLGDYFGLATQVPGGYFYSALPFRCHNLIFNEWFRDENLQDSVPVPKTDGPDNYTDYNLYRRGKRKDYISSSLPWPQKGPGVDLPLGTTAPVLGIGIETASANANTNTSVRETDGNTDTYAWTSDNAGGMGSVWLKTGLGSGEDPEIYADLSNASAATINDLRQAFQIQKLQERDARGGTRYTEIIRSHFRVISPDARLQRPEYLGGGHSAIQMNVVPQTSSTDATTPQGNLSAWATTTTTNHGFSKSFVEHGYILGYVQVRADLNYQNRTDKLWFRSTKYDFYWPALQALGEQAVLNKEVWMDGTSADDEPWGYQERWAEYKTNLGKITGRFRSNASATLDPWHYGLDHQTRPTLGSVFVEDVPPVGRTIAVPAEPEFYFDAWMDVQAARPMPVYSVPGYIDHF